MKIKVERIFKKDTNKDGVKLVSKKYGKPYWIVDVYVAGREQKITGFANSTSDAIYNMVEGGEYSVTLEERHVDDKVYTNFKLLTPEEEQAAADKAELEELRKMKLQGQVGVHTATLTDTAMLEDEPISLDNF